MLKKIVANYFFLRQNLSQKKNSLELIFFIELFFFYRENFFEIFFSKWPEIVTIRKIAKNWYTTKPKTSQKSSKNRFFIEQNIDFSTIFILSRIFNVFLAKKLVFRENFKGNVYPTKPVLRALSNSSIFGQFWEKILKKIFSIKKNSSIKKN